MKRTVLYGVLILAVVASRSEAASNSKDLSQIKDTKKKDAAPGVVGTNKADEKSSDKNKTVKGPSYLDTWALRGRNQVCVAISEKKPAAIASLVETGALNPDNINTRIPFMYKYELRTPLAWAVEQGEAAIVAELLKVPNVDTTVPIHDGQPPVIQAVCWIPPELLLALLEGGADLGVTTKDTEITKDSVYKQLGWYLNDAPYMKEQYEKYLNKVTPVIDGLVLHDIFTKQQLTFKVAWEQARSNANKHTVLAKALDAIEKDKGIDKMKAVRVVELYLNSVVLLPYMHEILTKRIRKLKAAVSSGGTSSNKVPK